MTEEKKANLAIILAVAIAIIALLTIGGIKGSAGPIIGAILLAYLEVILVGVFFEDWTEF